MKALYTAIIVATVAAEAAVASDSYSNYIIQTDNNPPEGVESLNRITDLDPNGSTLGAPVGPDGALFELFTLNNETNEETFLAEQPVTSFLPKATIEIETRDPYSSGLYPRTRADQPFSVKYTVMGLRIGDADAPEAAKAVDFSHSVTPTGATETVLSTVELDQNKTTEQNKLTSIPASDLTKADGLETFTITSKFHNNLDSSNLDAQSVRVFPVATASISGYDTNEVYNRIPDIDLVYTDLYPTSETWLRFIRVKDEFGASVSPSEEGNTIIIPATTRSFENEDELFSVSFKAINLDETITEAGCYIPSIVHTTPFLEEEVLIEGDQLKVKKTVEINGSIGASE